MQPQQQLHQAVGDQFMQREQFLVGFVNRMAVGTGLDARARLQGIGRFAQNWIFKRLTGHAPGAYRKKFQPAPGS